MDSKAYLCVFGAILINLTLGTFYSIGNLIPYIASYMRNNGNPDVKSEHGIWITSSFLLGQGLFMIVGSFIEQKYNSRIACIVGCVIHSTSTFLTIWALNVNLVTVILVYGFGSGMGCGSSYMASIIAAQKWFPHNKGLFTGIIVGGFGFGGLIFTSLQSLYMNPNNIAPDKAGYFSSAVYENVPYLFLYMGIIFAVTQAIGCFLSIPAPQQANLPSTASPSGDPNSNVTIMDGDSLPKMTKLSSAFNYRIFYVIGAMMMLVAPGVTFVNSLGKKYGQSYIQNDRFLGIVVAVSAIANALGRFLWGFLMDKFAFSICFTAKVIFFTSLIILFPFGFILGSETFYLIWMLGLFFGFSGTFVLFPVFIEQVFGSKFHGLVYGILYLFLALASILTSLLVQVAIAPAITNSTNPDESLGIRIAPCAVIATLYLVSLGLYILLIPVKRLENAIRRKVDSEIMRTRNTLHNRQDLYPIERPSLAEKTMGNSGINEGLRSGEGSLGSIVKFGNSPNNDEKRLKIFSKWR